MTVYDDARIQNALEHFETLAQQQAVQAEFDAARDRHPDVDPESLADAGEIFGWDFDSAADHIRQVSARAQAVYDELHPPTLGDVIDRFVSEHSG
jgi:hypothetical protein